MKKIFFVLFLVSVTLCEIFGQGYTTDNRTGILTGTQNVIDTIDLKNPLLKTQLVIVEVYSGTVIITHSQDGYTARDTTASYDSVTATDKVIQYINRQNKLIFITPRGGSATYQVKWSYGDGYGVRIGTSGASSATANLSGYAYKDSVNTYSMHQIMDSLTVTRLATIDTLSVATTILLPDGIFPIRWGSTGSIYSSSGDLWINSAYRFNSQGLLFGDGVTGQPFATRNADINNVHYGFYNDVNTGLFRNSADNISLVTGGTSRVAVSATSVTITTPLIVSGTSSYVLFPTMTETQKDALTPVQGMVVFNTDTSELQVFDGSTWVRLN